MSQGDIEREFLLRAGLLVLGSTLVLTASFVGLVALLVGEASQVGTRLPYYVLAMAVAFVVAIFLLDDDRTDGVTVFLASVGISFAAFAVTSLAGEGLTYAVNQPAAVLANNLLVYFLAAGLIGTGLGFWGLRHWREFAGPTGSGL